MIGDLFRRVAATRALACGLALWCFTPIVSKQAVACSESELSAAERFRSLFFSLGSARFSQEQLSSLLFFPSQGLVASDVVSWREGDSAMAQFDSFVRGWSPSSAYAAGLAHPPCTDEATSSGAVSGTAPLFIVIPELLGELVTNLPFQEIVGQTGSSFAREWRASLKNHPVADDLSDWSFDLARMGHVRRPMSDLFSVGSLDAPNGKPLARVVSMRALMGSTESIGYVADSSRIFLSRLNRFFNIIGKQERLFLVGYSRGAVVSLQMMSDAAAAPERFPWVSDVKGVVSLAGVNFGSVLADTVLTSGSPTNQVFSAIRELAASLEDRAPGDDSVVLARKVTANTYRWAKDGARFMQSLVTFPLAKGFQHEAEGLAIPARENLANFMRRLFLDTFQLDNPLSDYFANVKRFKLFVAQLERAIVELSSQERERWWREHRVPAGVDLLAIGATMGDPWNQTKGPWTLSKNPIAYEPSIFDYLFLRMSYYEALRTSSFSVNDGMVSIERAFFWPNLIASLNPENSALRIHNLGLFGVDHFGLALESAAPQSERSKSPFPRALMVQTLAAYVDRFVD
jgi:hypothetical protein